MSDVCAPSSRDLAEICALPPLMCVWASIEGMVTKELTPAELALHLGFALPMDADRSALGTESLVEAAWLGLQRVRYVHEHLAGAPDFHTYKLTEPQNAEDAFWCDTPLAEHTKYSIARHLERTHGWPRERLWRSKQEALCARRVVSRKHLIPFKNRILNYPLAVYHRGFFRQLDNLRELKMQNPATKAAGFLFEFSPISTAAG